MMLLNSEQMHLPFDGFESVSGSFLVKNQNHHQHPDTGRCYKSAKAPGAELLFLLGGPWINLNTSKGNIPLFR